MRLATVKIIIIIMMMMMIIIQGQLTALIIGWAKIAIYVLYLASDMQSTPS